jgi:hypothetical protein
MTATPPNYSGEVNADFSYSIKFPKVTFRDGDLVGPGSARVRVVVTATPAGRRDAGQAHAETEAETNLTLTPVAGAGRVRS